MKKKDEKSNILGLIIFAIFLGITLTKMGEKAAPMVRFFESLNEAIMNIVNLALWFAPFGIMSLIISKLGGDGNFWQKLGQMGMFVVTVVVGLLIHTMLVLPLIFFLFTRKNPYRYMLNLLPAILFALGTASSSATLPVTMKNCEENNDCSPKNTRFVLPLGATVNMNGTALYEGMAAIFAAQSLGMQLSIGQMVVIIITSTLAAVGAAGIPEAGLITMVMVFTAVNLPLDIIGLLFSVDWFLDRLRTVCNILGDAMGLGIVDHLDKKSSKQVLVSPSTFDASDYGTIPNDK